ncbi:MAG: hypothetical protein ABJG41_14565 [Cyclobacteriaceae bacterium]
MIDVIVGYDDNDSELGGYFELSFKEFEDACSSVNDLNVTSIAGLDCTQEVLKETVDSLDQNRFVFVGLLHGNDEQLLTDNDVFVDVEDIDHLSNSFFFSPSCSTANKLGSELIDKGCLCFIGCIRETYATYEDYYDIYIKCETECLRCFLVTGVSIESSYNQMMSLFDEQIALLSEENDEILVAMELIGNRDSFVIMGNRELRKSDLVSS